MQRTYLALAGLGLASSAALSAGMGLLPAPPRAWAQAWTPRTSLFEGQPVDPRRFAVLGRPLANGEWTLLVLEQIQPGPACWRLRSDGLVDPSLNRFDYTGICGRYLDSNGYSLRLANREALAPGGSPLRLQLQSNGSELQLLATAPELARELIVGRAPLPRRDRNAFVALQLAPGWELQRRSYQGQSLNHLYFAHQASADQLVAAAAREGQGGLRGLPLPPPPPPPVATRSPRWSTNRNGAPLQAAADTLNPGSLHPASLNPGSGRQGRAIALQVIPYRE